MLRLGAGLLAVSCATLATGAAASGVRGDVAPNIVMILADDVGIGDLGPYGQSVIQTPRFDQMAAEGSGMQAMRVLRRIGPVYGRRAV
ncbi:hypothetical protein [Mucisphaera sp.]|uniref:hypothetical protein n=1 Tax=Mucisphaera sp. TaxID=2913024 RepID=UPI003D0FB5D0